MPKRRARKNTNKVSPAPHPRVGNESQDADNCEALAQLEAERQTMALRATQDVETEHLLTAIRLLRSYFSKEELRTPVLQFIREHLPDIRIVPSNDSRYFELQWNDQDILSRNQTTKQGDMHVSLLNRLSMGYLNPTLSSSHDFKASRDTGVAEQTAELFIGKTSILESADCQMEDLVFERPADSNMQKGLAENLQTPVATVQRNSVGITPKTVRLPKNGEMLLSVHGSPLGVYKEDATEMEAIHEAEEV